VAAAVAPKGAGIHAACGDVVTATFSWAPFISCEGTRKG
jgi:hypothetical protein